MIIGAVEAQARVLDRIRPGWAEEIDVGKLDMLDEGYCILGQLYGHIQRAPKNTFVWHPGAYFMSPFCKRRWLRQIRKRVAMDPGKQLEPVRYEPLEHPVPAKREPAPMPDPEPITVPAAPEREKVPA